MGPTWAKIPIWDPHGSNLGIITLYSRCIENSRIIGQHCSIDIDMLGIQKCFLNYVSRFILSITTMVY